MRTYPNLDAAIEGFKASGVAIEEGDEKPEGVDSGIGEGEVRELVSTAWEGDGGKIYSVRCAGFDMKRNYHHRTHYVAVRER